MLYKYEFNEETLSYAEERDEIHCQSVNENESLGLRKELLFSPYIFHVSDLIEDHISELILKNGGMVTDSIDETVSHVICNKSEESAARKDIVYVKASWIEDCARLSCLLSPFARKYIIQ